MGLIKVNDMVEVISGRVRHQKVNRGKVLRVFREEERVLVEGLNTAFKHVRKSKKNPQGGGRLEREMPLHVSNVLLVCPHCDKAVRTSNQRVKDGDRVQSIRVCRKCKKEIR